MAKDKDEKEKNVFITGVNLPPLDEGGEERRYEEGEKIPELTPKERKALKELGAIEK